MTPRDRLTPLDASFLRVETPTAHMHVAWRGRFRPQPGHPVTLDALRASVAARLTHAPRFRRKLAPTPGGLAEARWIDDPDFDLSAHVVRLDRDRLDGQPLALDEFASLTDRVLSEPLDRRRPLWQIELAPKLEDGTVGLVMKIHHAMVDGKSAVELVLLLLNVSPDPALVTEIAPWEPASPPGAARLVADALVDQGVESLRAARSIARMAASPNRLGSTLRRTAISIGEDVLRPAPASSLNAQISARRTLVGHAQAVGPLLEVKQAAEATLNDVALAVVAGALRQLKLSRDELPRALKTMVPVSTRAPEEAADLGNKIAFVFVDLPLQLRSPRERLAAVQKETNAFKRDGRSAGGELLLGSLGLLPGPLKTRAAQLAASPRMYNLTVSNVPGPRVPVYLLGAELEEAFPVIPLADGHTLSVGIFSYCDRIHFSVYADPDALPQARELPGALGAAALELGRAWSTPRIGRRRGDQALPDNVTPLRARA